MSNRHPNATQPFNLLVIEDNPIDAELTQDRLSTLPEYSFQFSQVESLAQAFEYLETIIPDAVLLDLNLPDSTGLDTLRSIRRRVSNVPVIVTSGATDEALRREVLHEGAQDCIDKNDPPSRLLARSILYAADRHEAQQRQADLETIVTANPDAILVVDPFGRTLLQNDAAVELFRDCSPDGLAEIVGRSLTETGVLAMDIPGPDGTRKGEVRTSDISWDGEPARLVVVRDRTREYQLNEEMRQAQKLNALGRLAGGVAHDFNNLLTVIIGYTDLMLSRDIDATSMREMLVEIHEAGERAKALTTQLLAFGRKSAGVAAPIDVNAVLTGLRRMLRRLVGDTIELRFEWHDGPCWANMDRGQLEQAMVNLVVNATDAIGSDPGTITVSSRVVSIAEIQNRNDIVPAGVYVVIDVTDTGSGMSREVANRVFEPFFTTKDVGSGTGLGLATTYGIVTQHGGTVLLETAEGVGSTFSLLLPAVEPAEQDETDKPEDVQVEQFGHGEHILYVEDDDAVRRMRAMHLEAHNYRVTAFPGPLKALEAVRSTGWQSYDMVFSDVSMPVMNGFAFVETLRTELGADLPALFATGYVFDGQHAPAGDVVLQKPVAPRELFVAIRETLARSSKTHRGEGASTP